MKTITMSMEEYEELRNNKVLVITDELKKDLVKQMRREYPEIDRLDDVQYHKSIWKFFCIVSWCLFVLSIFIR